MRCAVIGAGPAGFYAADKLLAAGFEVDLLDALPTPFGLVRSGVAPDHPNIKAVTRVYEKTAAKPGFRFFGGVVLGEHVSRASCSSATTRSSTPRAPTSTGGWASRGRTCRARIRPRASSPGTTATPTPATSASISAPSGRW
jgi:flavin-dependent dehydrogenase